jgi:hypothetical protein
MELLLCMNHGKLNYITQINFVLNQMRNKRMGYHTGLICFVTGAS